MITFYAPNQIVTDGVLTGFHIEQIEYVAAQLQQPIGFKRVAWSRALWMMETGQGNVLSYVGWSKPRSQFLIYNPDNEISKGEYIFAALKGKQIEYDGDLSKLTSYRIGVSKGFVYGEKFERTDDINKRLVNNSTQWVNLLHVDEIDLAVTQVAELQGLQRNQAAPDIIALDPIIESSPIYIVFSKPRKRQAISSQFGQALRSFKQTAAYQALRQKYGYAPSEAAR